MAKQIKTLEDAQRVINDLYDRIELLRTKDWDFHGLKITGASDGVDPQDYVTVRQLQGPSAPTTGDFIYRTIVFSKDGQVTTGEFSPGFIVGRGIEGQPVEVWVCTEVGYEPSGGDLVINISWTRYSNAGVPTVTNLLTNPLHLPNSTSNRVFSSAFANPVPFIGRGSKLNKVIVTGSNASFVSIGLVMKIGLNIR